MNVLVVAVKVLVLILVFAAIVTFGIFALGYIVDKIAEWLENL